MGIAEIVLEYLKVFLTAPVLFSIVALVFLSLFLSEIRSLINRIAKIKIPGGGEVSTPQSNSIKDEDEKPIPQVGEQTVTGLPPGLTPTQSQAVEQLVRSHIATSYLWEYRYLNHFLQRGTQEALDWLIGLPHPTTYAHYDSFWLPLIPPANERHAIISALQMHHLIVHEGNDVITVTPKGLEYQEWRGVLPARTPQSIGQ
ncbi:MAG: hypothetical protein ABJ308_13170 [Halieaceae bacterium]